jgi:hypothetical protein
VFVKRRAAVSIAELLADGVPVHPTEAVAIVRRLCATADDQPPRVSHPTKIVLLAEGTLLTGTGRERGAPATAVLATLLQALVDRAPLGHRPPAGLSEVAARALGVPGTVGFETAAAFSQALNVLKVRIQSRSSIAVRAMAGDAIWRTCPKRPRRFSSPCWTRPAARDGRSSCANRTVAATSASCSGAIFQK